MPHPLRQHVGIRLSQRKLRIDSLLPSLSRSHERRQIKISVRTRDEVGSCLEKPFLGTLGHAADHANYQTTRLLTATQLGQSAKHTLLSIFTNRARVDEYAIGLRRIDRRLIADGLHYSSDHLTVGDIHLAAIRFYK